MADTILDETALGLRQDWDLELPGTISEEAILQLLTERIVTILERGAETFYQLMYRIDISERKLNAILNEDNVPAKIARLIYDRQLEKIKSRHENRMRREDLDPELQW
jgi:hypothetical protein